MKRAILYFSLVIWACEAPQVESSQAPVVPLLETDSEQVAISRNGAVTLVNSSPYSGYLLSYYENGQLKSKTGFVNGLKEGKAWQYYQDGSLKEVRAYWNNRKHGNHQGWWPGGQPKFDYSFEKGLQQGASKEWYQNGQPFRFFTYVNSKEEGAQKMWEESGQIRANYVVKGGHRYGLIGLKNCKSVSDEKGVFTARAY